jgi:chemotaxis protein methyltransferase CheR
LINLFNNPIKKLRNYLKTHIGIFIEDDKLDILEKKLKTLLEKENISINELYKKIAIYKDENYLQKVINLLTVNETYFFREKYQFDTLINYVIPYLDKIRDENEVISILVAPCASGEELYSIAIMLLEEGNFIKKRDFSLLGIDIDSQMIQKCKEGRYNERSISKLPKEIIEKYFKKEGIYYIFDENIRKVVTYKKVNVLDKYAMKKLGKFDVIFSRNMLIYFDEKEKQEVIATFYEILKDEGFLFLGHAERIPKNIKLFKLKKIGESFVYKKNSDS